MRYVIPTSSRPIIIDEPDMPAGETFGLPACDTHLIAKLRNMDPALRETVLPKAPADPEGIALVKAIHDRKEKQSEKA